MKSIMLLLIAATIAVPQAFAETGKGKATLTKEERNRLRLEKTGGIITRIGEGKAVVVNCQTKFPQTTLSSAMQQFKEILKVEIEIRDGKWSFGDKIPSDSNIALYVIDDPGLPMSLVATEAKWGVANVSQISDEPSFKKQVSRIAIATFGAGVSQYKISPMQPVFSVHDLSRLMGCTLTVDSTLAIKANLEKLGMTQTKMTTYRKACEEGWAPQPTNEYQKAIWDKVHAIPDKPLTIEYDPKKDK